MLNIIFDIAGFIVGLLSLTFFVVTFLRGPEVYRESLLFSLTGLAFFTVSFFISLLLQPSGAFYAEGEILHHALMTFGVLCFVFSGWKFMKAGR